MADDTSTAPSLEALAAAADLLDGPGAAAVAARDVVVVEGPDAGRYLQGQLSQDVPILGVGAATWSLLLQPTGKVDAWVRVHRPADEVFAVDVDAGWGDVVAARLRRFLLRTKATVADPERRAVLALRHAAGFVAIGAGGALAEDEAWWAGPAVGPGVAGIDRVAPAGTTAGAVTAAAEAEDMALVPAAALERYRIAHLVPAMGAELTDATIPAEGGQWLVDASVSFTKGCYTGQELVARIDSRGNTVPRPVRLLQLLDLPPGAAPAPGTAVHHDGAPDGVVTSATPALDAAHPALALALVPRAVPVGTEVSVEVAGHGPARAVVLDAPRTGAERSGRS